MICPVCGGGFFFKTDPFACFPFVVLISSSSSPPPVWPDDGEMDGTLNAFDFLNVQALEELNVSSLSDADFGDVIDHSV